MADFIVIADMGEQFDIRKEILENATEEEADNLAWELANELYSSYEDPSRIINAYESGKIVDNDIVIILGDAGFNYYHNHKWGI